MEIVSRAVSVIREGGIIAYPTEYCFGLGCDPTNRKAVERVLTIKRRSAEQGLLLIAAERSQVDEYANLDSSPIQDEILSTWPGPVTWTLPARDNVPVWIKGRHPSIAMRVTAHALSAQICQKYGHAIVSTSANRHAQSALLTAQEVETEIGKEVDFTVHADIGSCNNPDDPRQASTIRDGITGVQLR